LLGHVDVSTTKIYTHVLKVAARGTTSPLDALRQINLSQQGYAGAAEPYATPPPKPHRVNETCAMIYL
jgi:hypothetical protein